MKAYFFLSLLHKVGVCTNVEPLLKFEEIALFGVVYCLVVDFAQGQTLMEISPELVSLGQVRVRQSA